MSAKQTSQLITSSAEQANFQRDALSIFPSALGWFGLIGRDGVVRHVLVGHPSEKHVRKAAFQIGQIERDELDWHPALRERLVAYAVGERVVFDDFQLDVPTRTEFQSEVLLLTRKLGYGETTTYGDLARKASHPGAARAVGTVMSTNRFPILIPCHRVVAAGGKLGGYTSPRGTELKQRLLEMERGFLT